MDESSQFLIMALAFFLCICLFAFILETSRASRVREEENRRHDNRMQEARAFGFDAVTERDAANKSARRFIK